MTRSGRTSFGWIVAACCLDGAAIWLNGDPRMRPWPPVLVWLGAMACVAIAGLRAPSATSGVAPAAPAPPRGTEVAAVIALTAVALVARVVAIDRIPRVVNGDEGSMGMMARAIIDGRWNDIFATGWFGHPALWFAVQAGALKTLGDDVVALRTLSALIGTAAIPALHAFLRPWFGAGLAGLSAALLASYHVHIHYSRIALNNIADPLMALTVLGPFLSAIRAPARAGLKLALSGLALGVAQHLYVGSRLLPILLAMVVGHALLLDRQRLLTLGWRLAFVPLGAIVAMGPLLVFFIGHPDDFNARLVQVGLFQSGSFHAQLRAGRSAADILLEQAWQAFGAYTSVADQSPFYGTMPLLDRLSSVLFVVGVVAMALRWRESVPALMLLWLLATATFGAMLIVDAPQSPRFVIATPAVCTAVALGVWRVGAWVGGAAGRRWPGAATRLAAAAAIVAINAVFYFSIYTPTSNIGGLNNEAAHRLALLVADRGDRTFVYFFTRGRLGFRSFSSLLFIARGLDGIDIDTTSGKARETLPAPPPGRRALFVFLPEALADLGGVHGAFPGGHLRRFDAVATADAVLFYTYELP